MLTFAHRKGKDLGLILSFYFVLIYIFLRILVWRHEDHLDWQSFLYDYNWLHANKVLHLENNTHSQFMYQWKPNGSLYTVHDGFSHGTKSIHPICQNSKRQFISHQATFTLQLETASVWLSKVFERYKHWVRSAFAAAVK